MEKLTHYHQLLRQLFEHYAQPRPSYPPGVEKVFVLDEERGHFILLKIGWHEAKRVEWLMLYVRLKDGQIHIETDATEDGITNELLAAGVPQSDIVLAFQHPQERLLTEFAAA